MHTCCGFEGFMAVLSAANSLVGSHGICMPTTATTAREATHSSGEVHPAPTLTQFLTCATSHAAGGAAARRRALDTGMPLSSLPLWEAHAALLDGWLPFLLEEAAYAADLLLLRE